jgi:predicted DNA-binding mobile mystery protein A
MKLPRNLALRQIERRLEALRPLLTETTAHHGWVRYMRRALGMSTKVLAERAGLALSTVSQTEHRELEGRVSVRTLRRLAAAMDCELVYAIVPKQSLSEAIMQQARSKARAALGKADTHMMLEDQRVTDPPLDERIEQLAERLIERGDIW